MHRHLRSGLGRFEALRLKKVMVTSLPKPSGAQESMTTCAFAPTEAAGNCKDGSWGTQVLSLPDVWNVSALC